MALHVAIIGSGPAGFYTADALLKSGADVEIDIVERLPTPFGLIRGGVAPDHQSTKRVSRAYDKTARHARVSFFGNVEVGRDVPLSFLKEAYDAVVLAIGAPLDRPMGIPGEDKLGVYGSASFVGWYNGHPDFRDLDPPLGHRAAVVIGNGNVAIDVARVLVKTRDEMRESDLPHHVADAIAAGAVREVHMVGRRGPVEAKFTNVELREMGELDDAHPVVDPAILPDAVTGEMDDRSRRLAEKNLASLRHFTTLDPGAKAKRVHFDFYARPVEILGGSRVEGLRLERTKVEGGHASGTGEFFDLPCGLVIAAIGYYAAPFDGVPFDAGRGVIVNANGHVEDNVYVAGWVKRGPTGVIGTNKPDGDEAAQQILSRARPSGRPGREGLARHLAGRGVRVVRFDDWEAIDKAETAAAAEGAPRRKFVSVEEMLEILAN